MRVSFSRDSHKSLGSLESLLYGVSVLQYGDVESVAALGSMRILLVLYNANLDMDLFGFALRLLGSRHLVIVTYVSEGSCDIILCLTALVENATKM